MTPLYWLTRQFLRLVYFSPLSIHVEGLDNIPDTGPAVMVANHPCALDGHLLCALSPRQFYSFARSDLYQSRLARFHFWSVGSIPVTVGGDNQAAMDRAIQLLREGNIFVLLPESDVFPGTELHHFHGSFMKLSLLTGAPILPVAIVGTEKALANPRPNTLRGLRPLPCQVFVHFLPSQTFDIPSGDRPAFSMAVEQVKGLIQGKVWEIAANR